MQHYNRLYPFILSSVKTFSPTAHVQANMHEHMHRFRYTEDSHCVTCWFYVSVSHTHSLGVDSVQSAEVESEREEQTEGNHNRDTEVLQKKKWKDPEM